MNLISDLALILIIAGLTSLLFRRLKQPLILGYILAGFLASPHMPYTPSVSDMASIQTWSEIGVIFIMFTLGLEFSFKKIVKMGSGPIIAALCIIFFMISIGSGVGKLFGWTSMNSLFLGGMLAMSSTTVIYKSLDELGLRQRKFAQVVLSVLILEDILGILLMVILSALAASHTFEGSQLVGSMLKLAFMLVLWFVVGMYVVPTLFRKSKPWLSSETLLVMSLGLCFLLVVLAEEAGYSSALGAFMMGSILAETTMAENIEKTVGPVKDLFGAIFFVSVGMLVDPAVLAEYWLPILVIVLAILLGQTIFGTLSFMISGQNLKTAMQCGFSLTQIGEFSFILAALGNSLGVTSDYLYPVVVAVSIITTFLTPYLIKAAEPAYNAAARRMPSGLKQRLDAGRQREADGKSSPGKEFLTDLLISTAAYFVVAAAVVAVSFSTFVPFFRGLIGQTAGNWLGAILALLAVSFFLRPIVMKKYHSSEVKQWRQSKNRGAMAGFYVSLVLRFILASGVAYYILSNLLPSLGWANALIAPAFVLLICVEHVGKLKNRICLWVKYISIRIERIFLQNLRQREVRQRRRKPGYAFTLQRHDIHLAELTLPTESAWGGKRLKELKFTNADGIMVAAVIRGDSRLNIPDGNTMIFPGDTLEVIGDDESLKAFSERMSASTLNLTPNDREHRLVLDHFTIGKNSPFAGDKVYGSGIRTVYKCMLVGKETSDGAIQPMSANDVIEVGDTLWVVGEDVDASKPGIKMLQNANKR